MNPDRAVMRARKQLLNLLSQLPQGSRLPGERSLADEFSVCRVTLRRSIEDLIADGRLERRARSGTYVKRPIISSEMRLKSFTEEIKSKGQEPSSSLISLQKIKSNKIVAKSLRIKENDHIFVVSRIRLADNVPVALETLRIACQSIPSLNSKDLDGSIYDVFLKKYGVRILSARAGISAHNPSTKEGELLQIPSDTPCLLIKMLDFDQNGKPVMTAECLYRSDLFELQMDITASIRDINNQRVS